jgi:hypothetical protein
LLSLFPAGLIPATSGSCDLSFEFQETTFFATLCSDLKPVRDLFSWVVSILTLVQMFIMINGAIRDSSAIG